MEWMISSQSLTLVQCLTTARMQRAQEGHRSPAQDHRTDTDCVDILMQGAEGTTLMLTPQTS